MFIRDPLQRGSAAGRMLREVFGLTEAETCLATALQSGISLEQYARNNTGEPEYGLHAFAPAPRKDRLPPRHRCRPQARRTSYPAAVGPTRYSLSDGSAASPPAEMICSSSIFRSSRAASSALTSVIGSRTSALSINPVRHSQCLIGAGLGSANNSSCQFRDCSASAPMRRRDCPAAISLPHLRKGLGLDMSRRQDAAIGAIEQRLVILRVLAGQNGEIRTRAGATDRATGRDRRAILQPDDVRMTGQPQHRLVAEIDAGPVGDVVDQDRMRGAIGERFEVQLQSALRGPRIIRARDQIAVDRPRRRSLQRVQ